MKIAAAQIEVSLGEIETNLEKHYKWIDLAAKQDIDLILFPELSVTGYCREEAKVLAMPPVDAQLNILKKKAIEKNIIIVAGAPVKIEEAIHIGSLIFLPNGELKIYTKQYLHDGEEHFYSSSFAHNPILEINGEKIAFAICADIENKLHPEKACAVKSTVYLPSIFYTRNGIDGGIEKLQTYAQMFSMQIVMANFIGEHWNLQAGGKSCVINKSGAIESMLTENTEGLVITEKKGEGWNSTLLEIN